VTRSLYLEGLSLKFPSKVYHWLNSHSIYWFSICNLKFKLYFCHKILCSYWFYKIAASLMQSSCLML
jgi:hypothetical protein